MKVQVVFKIDAIVEQRRFKQTETAVLFEVRQADIFEGVTRRVPAVASCGAAARPQHWGQMSAERAGQGRFGLRVLQRGQMGRSAIRFMVSRVGRRMISNLGNGCLTILGGTPGPGGQASACARLEPRFC